MEGILPDFVYMDDVMFSYEFTDFVSVRTTHKNENAQKDREERLFFD